MDLVSAYANGVSELTNFSASLERAPLIVDVIANPRAGFFKRQATVQKLLLELEQKLSDLRKCYPRRKVEINTVHFTEYPGHARVITEQILEGEEKARSGMEHLLIGCGGDGTSNEICTALVDAEGSLLERLKLLRLPLGTGNDVADAPTFAQAYELILGAQRTVKTGALQVTTALGRSIYSFNVGSIGLDAYIAGLTNKFKRIIPGQAYKLMVDVGSLFYDPLVRPGVMDIRLHGAKGVLRLDSLVPSMVIVGISGRRTYGGHMSVLPGAENVCVVGSMSVWKKIRSKKKFYAGRHGELSEVRFFDAERVDVAYAGHRIPMQLDGELTWLSSADFPVTLRVLPSKISVLRA
ncbi:MAG TPA: diacylglycerol kinase family protein [Spirochaetia bacterium]|nr:diacylglycerol kinase family protein [Spirochaetia bacterium]